MSEKGVADRPFHWVDSGASAMALCTALMNLLIKKGVMSDAEINLVAREAIKELSGNDQWDKAAQNIKTIFPKCME